MVIAGIVIASLVGLVALLGIVGLLLPRRWRLERSVSVEAPPSAIFPLVNDFAHGWSQWNPFVEPGMTVTYEGPSAGIGAISKWARGRETGTMKMLESSATKGVVYDCSMNNGFSMTGRIAFERRGSATLITWSDDGEIANPFFRFFPLLMKGMIGGKLEQGLAGIKKLAEAVPSRV